MHKARRHSFHTTDNAIQNHRSRPTRRGTLLLAFVNGKLLAEGEVLQDDRLMTFSKEPNQSK
jgi:hypothetical protein